MAACPALLVAAPASGQGKTTVTAALARLHARQGRRVTVFKCGPDFLDPQIHAFASGRPCRNLDLGMCGEADAAWRLAAAAADSDLILIEGVMGLFDGKPSAADIACRFGIPVLALIDAGAMAQTFGAVAHGLASYRPGLPFAGVLATASAVPITPNCSNRACRPAWAGSARCRAATACPSATSACCRRPRSTTSAPASTAWPTRWPPRPRWTCRRRSNSPTSRRPSWRRG
jgi:cobyrinic acid a,c-diamide synthase